MNMPYLSMPIAAGTGTTTLPAPSATSAASATSATSAADKAKLRQAGEQFEAMMLEQLLASARPSASGPESDWRSMADRAVAETLAGQSPLGLADLIERIGQ